MERMERVWPRSSRRKSRRVGLTSGTRCGILVASSPDTNSPETMTKRFIPFGVAVFTWPEGGFTVVFEKGQQVVHMETDGVTHRSVRHHKTFAGNIFDRLCDAAERHGATEVGLTKETLLAFSEVPADVSRPARTFLNLLT